MDIKDIPMLNILVAGKTGVGKTTLVNCIFSERLGEVRVGSSVTTGIQKRSLSDFPITVYDVQGFEIGVATDEIMREIKTKIREEQVKVKENSLIDAVLYCIAYGGDRIENKEAEFIRQLTSEYKVPLFLVFTQAYAFDRENPITDSLTVYAKSMNLPVDGYFHVVCESKYFSAFKSTVEPFGLDELMNKLFEVLPSNKANALAFAAKAKIEHKHDVAVTWIWGYAATNFVFGAVIPPGVDILYLVGTESAMALHISKILYDGNDKEVKDLVAEVIAVCAGPLLASVGGTIAFNEVIKVLGYAGIIFTAGASEAAAALAGGTIAAGLTIAMGRVYLWILEGLLNGKISKNKLLSKDPKTMDMITNKMKEFYAESKKQIKKDNRFSKEKFHSKNA